MYEKERSIIENKLRGELLSVNSYIDKVESYSAITAPESSLGVVLSEQSPSDIELKHYYLKKRKLLNFLNRLPDVSSFLCSNCGEMIDIDRLLIMPKASLCGRCASEIQD